MTWLDRKTKMLIVGYDKDDGLYSYPVPMLCCIIEPEEWDRVDMGNISDENYMGLVCALIARAKGW